MVNEQLKDAFKLLVKVLVKSAPDGPFSACVDETGLYGVEDGHGELVYESDTNQFQAELTAWLLNQDETLDWDDIAPLVMLFEPPRANAIYDSLRLGRD